MTDRYWTADRRRCTEIVHLERVRSVERCSLHQAEKAPLFLLAECVGDGLDDLPSPAQIAKEMNCSEALAAACLDSLTAKRLLTVRSIDGRQFVEVDWPAVARLNAPQSDAFLRSSWQRRRRQRPLSRAGR